MKKIILASASPRRSELLKKHGVDFTVLVSSADEINVGESPKTIAEQNAYLKAREVYDSLENKENIIVIGADTVVALGDTIYGKPKDKADAINMLKTLSGKEHSVITGVAIIKNENGEVEVLKPSEETFVKFKALTDEEIEDYTNTNEPYDKAGSYALQGEAKKFVEYVKGDSENVIGLPAGKIKKYLIQVKI